MSIRTFIATGLVAVVTVGCGGGNDPTPGQEEDAIGAPGAPGESAALPACSPDSPPGEPCVDALGAVQCPVDSGYPGDGLALCDQGSEAGMLLHYGPSDYDDPDQVESFLLPAGGEDENCTFVRTPNTDDRLVKGYRGRMRPNSHHLIVTIRPEDGFVESDEPHRCNLADVVNAEWFVGSQDPQIDVIVGGGGDSKPEPGDPDYGLGQSVPAGTPLQIDSHYTNPTDATLLREVWMWFDYAEPSEVETLVDMITFYQGRIDVPPQAAFTTSRSKCVAPSDRYVWLVTGHAHAAMTRFSVWHEDAAGSEELVYETYDWADPGNLIYRDGIDNPVPNADTGTFGGKSGYLLVREGESLSFECEYFNPGADRVTLGSTAEDEMCNVFGMYFPTDGDVWNCACLGERCFDKVPEGIDIFSLN